MKVCMNKLRKAEEQKDTTRNLQKKKSMKKIHKFIKIKKR